MGWGMAMLVFLGTDIGAGVRIGLLRSGIAGAIPRLRRSGLAWAFLALAASLTLG
jgi:hypothetical protein